MANVLTSNPKYIDTAASSDCNKVLITKIQWIDDAMDVADGDDLAFTINGVSIAMKRLLGSDVGHQPCVIYEADFPRGFYAETFVVTVIDHGVLLLWTR